MGKQKRAIGAGLIDDAKKWKALDWEYARRQVRRLQVRIDANPYLPEYAEYFWNRRNNRGSKLLAAMSAREYRARQAA